MLDPDPSERIKADFFIELYTVRNDRFVNSLDWFSKDRFTKQMLHRYKEKRLKAVTDFRKVKQAITQARLIGKDDTISKRLKEFAENLELDIDHLEISSAAISAEAKSMTKQASKLVEFLNKIEVDSYLGEDDLWESLETLREIIQMRLLEAGRRLK